MGKYYFHLKEQWGKVDGWIDGYTTSDYKTFSIQNSAF